MDGIKMADQMFAAVTKARFDEDRDVAAEIDSILQKERHLLAEDMLTADLERLIGAIVTNHDPVIAVRQAMMILRSAAHFKASQRVQKRETYRKAFDAKFFQQPDLEPSVVRGTL